MIFKRRHLDYALAGLLLLLPALVLRANLREPARHSKLDSVVLRISSPLQALVGYLVGGVGELWNDYLWLVNVEDENDELRELNLRLREELTLSKKNEHTLAELEKLLALKGQTHAETASARVIASSINAHFRVGRIKIDRNEDEVEVGMPVVSAYGLVGRILRAHSNYSDVLLISDPQSAIDVVIPSTKGRGLLRGIASDDSYECEIEYLEEGRTVRVGDRVVTSGLGKHFPEGLDVGEISQVEVARHGLYQRVRVRPAVDFSSLGAVLVLLAKPPPQDPNRDKNRKSVQAFGVEPF